VIPRHVPRLTEPSGTDWARLNAPAPQARPRLG
jgi:hypothetical protein